MQLSNARVHEKEKKKKKKKKKKPVTSDISFVFQLSCIWFYETSLRSLFHAPLQITISTISRQDSLLFTCIMPSLIT